MTNIFKDANYGDKFITRDGQCALLLEVCNGNNKATIWLPDYGVEFYNYDGTHEEYEDLDIIGKWKGGANE